MKVILGDNPFFGVNHLTGSKRLDSESDRFTQASRVIQTAVSGGLDTFMVSNHPSLPKLLDIVYSSESCKSSLRLAFVLPYPHTFNDIVASKGYLGLVTFFLTSLKFKHIMLLFLDLIKLKIPYSFCCDILIDSQLKALGKKKNYVSYICLHNIFVDMALSLGNSSFLKAFDQAVKKRGLKTVFITQNLPSLLTSYEADYIACFSFNRMGYMVNPCTTAVLECIENTDKERLWAMQILASGSDHPIEALKYLADCKLEKILYATSKENRILDFITKAKEFK